MQKVQIVKVEDAGTYKGEGYTYGGTVNVTLQRGGDFVSCDGILIFEEADIEDYFDEWVACAVAGEEGYSAMIGEGDKTVMYSN
jgi:hypothetical protein